MDSVIAAPVDWIKSVGNLRLPAKADHRLQELMHRNNEGLLSNGEREELEALVELSEQLSLVRAEALQMLGKQPERTRLGNWQLLCWSGPLIDASTA